MTGNRLAGDDGRGHRSIKVPQPLWDAFGEWCDEEGTNRSEAVRRFMARKVSTSTEEENRRFTDERLTRAYRALEQVADPRGRIPGGVAKNTVAQALGVPKAEAARVALKPLEIRGAITVPRPGVVEIVEAD